MMNEASHHSGQPWGAQIDSAPPAGIIVLPHTDERALTMDSSRILTNAELTAMVELQATLLRTLIHALRYEGMIEDTGLERLIQAVERRERCFLPCPEYVTASQDELVAELLQLQRWRSTDDDDVAAHDI